MHTLCFGTHPRTLCGLNKQRHANARACNKMFRSNGLLGSIKPSYLTYCDKNSFVWMLLFARTLLGPREPWQDALVLLVSAQKRDLLTYLTRPLLLGRDPRRPPDVIPRELIFPVTWATLLDLTRTQASATQCPNITFMQLRFMAD